MTTVDHRPAPTTQNLPDAGTLDSPDPDPINIERCITGTLPASLLTSEERDIVVARLFQRRMSNWEIAHQARMELGAVRPILIRLGLVRTCTYRLEPNTPRTCTDDQAQRVRSTVLRRAHNLEDARELLLALGLVERTPTWTSGPVSPPENAR